MDDYTVTSFVDKVIELKARNIIPPGATLHFLGGTHEWGYDPDSGKKMTGSRKCVIRWETYED